MKHEGFTPGPWHAPTMRVVHCSKDLLLADVYAATDAERAANAALIADAPALLAERDRLRALLKDANYALSHGTDASAYLPSNLATRIMTALHMASHGPNCPECPEIRAALASSKG